MPFEPEELETRIIKCCLSSGSKDVWIAQDISLSVEHALVSQASEDSSTVRAAELDALVSKILDDTGYHEVAESFRKSTPKGEAFLDYSSQALLLELLAKRTALSGQPLRELAAKTAAALKAMGVSKCSPQLPLELAKHFKEASSELPQGALHIEIPKSAKSDEAHWLADAKALQEDLPAEAASLVQAGALTPRSLSRLFPSLRVDVSLFALARKEALERPANELALVQRLGPLSAAIDALCLKADSLSASAGRSDCLPLPLWLFFSDASEFASSWLSCDKDADCGPCQEIASSLASSLSRTPFKTTLK